jgi:hypothetical protein
MVLHRPVETARVIGKFDLSGDMKGQVSDNAVSRTTDSSGHLPGSRLVRIYLYLRCLSMRGCGMINSRSFLAIYSGILTLAFASVVLMGARKSAHNASFDQITVRRINVVEPDGTTRLVISNHADFPGAYFTENGGLIFGGKKDKDGTAHSWGHLSFDQYQRDQTMVLESNNDGSEWNVYYAVNDDDRTYSLTPECSAE